MRRVFACLWRGTGLPKFSQDVYGVDYVKALVCGVERCVPDADLILLVDDYYWKALKDVKEGLAPITICRFEGHGIGGWSNILEVCRPSLWPVGDEYHMHVGLDTVFINNCEWLFEWDKAPVGLPLDPFHAPLPCNGVWTFNREGAELVWNAYLAAGYMREHRLFGVPSEMQLLRALDKEHRWPRLEEVPKKLLSYKVHVRRGVPWKDASIVYLHGTPKQHDLHDHDPVKKIWMST